MERQRFRLKPKLLHSIEFNHDAKEATSDHTEDKAKMSKGEDTAPPENGRSSSKPTNEYVLNVAFYSFVGFMSVQAVFALIANSEAMLADSEAMSVDAFTYLFNLWAERIKREPQSGHDSSVVLYNYRQELRRLYLELIPPAISVATLIVVTVFTLKDALKTMRGQGSGEEDQDVDISIMLFFSGLNLLLDVVNVTCFARADSAFGLNVMRHKGVSFSDSIRRSLRPSLSSNQSILTERNADESSNLLPLAGSEMELETATTTTSFASSTSDQPPSTSDQPNDLVNLNMCSAWTHICADTMRSVAVFVAAGIATAFPSIAPAMADAVAALAVSVTILISILPLLHGLVWTAVKIYTLTRNPPSL